MLDQWQASFISAAAPSAEGDPAPYFRREFEVSPGLRRAMLHVTALGIVAPYVNGVRVGDEELMPGWTSYRHRLMVSGHDVTHLLTPGPNAFGAVVGEGWAVGPLTWENRRHNYTDRPALLAQLELDFGDRVEVLGTDGSFRVGTGGVRANGIYAGETFDTRLEPDGWDRPGFDDTGWNRAVPFVWDRKTLQVPTAPPIRRIEELAPKEILTSPAGRTIVDFGQNFSGWVRMTVTGEAGKTITLRHAELLTPGGELDTETNRTAAATDRYTLRGDGEESWEPRFTFHGFRYVEVDGWPGEPGADAIRAVVIHTDMARTGWFETSHPLVNKLHENTVWSMRGNFVGIPTDCPQRDERLGWTGDINAFAPTAAFLYDVRGVLGSWLRDLAAEQQETGNVPMVVPDVLATGSTPTALWGDVAISLPWLLYQEYGDPAILRDSYASMTAFMRQIEPALDEHGLWSSGFQFGDWLDPDAPAGNPAGGKTDAHLVAGAYLCKTTRELAQAASVLGETEDAEHFGQLAERVRAAFRREYVTEAGRVVNESATAYALAIMFGILDDDQRATAGRQLAELVRKAGFTISTGFAGTPLITDALSGTGHLVEAYELLLQKKPPSFLYPVTMGATTIWERWDSILPDGTLNSTGMTSLNHYALGAVADWLHRVVGGLERAEPGWRHIRIAPKPGGGLRSAHTAHQTVLGRAEVRWTHGDGEMHVEVTVPPGATATVELPRHPEQLVEHVGSGSHSWRYPAPDESAKFDMDTPLWEIQRNDTVWAAIVEVLRSYFPGVPIESGGDRMGMMSLSTVAASLPDGGAAELERVLEAALKSEESLAAGAEAQA
ncbi:glycoside hydrolase family 78 protein [Amycolatopsis vastitatis]|uniref:alpha-L-rhamnosidase n=1 Tax=Amycolatopsis vastitatis TaxID=1905142 RepID=A0A229SM79_9PSEU|nr:glycoside hydrolase family 78 protein [Amycolatopsis vastitatis]OXM59791.1 alpha-L-rhamnosidase [Amycolatopsis vastitatis]